MPFLTNLEWRYATKKFDTAKKVSAENLAKITEAIRLTPTSLGLEAYHFYIIHNDEKNAGLLNSIQAVSWGQPQITTCSGLIIMVARNDFEAAKNEMFEVMSGGNPEVRTSLANYETMVDGVIANVTVEWAKKQCYIALGFAMAACAELSIDSCPMEGFDGKAVTELLKMPANHEVALFLPIGYRADDDKQHPKFRRSEADLITQI